LSKIRPFGAGFLIFSDYMKPPIRLSALMELPVIYVFTHDSIGVGNSPHQPHVGPIRCAVTADKPIRRVLPLTL
jgi:transketolase